MCSTQNAKWTLFFCWHFHSFFSLSLSISSLSLQVNQIMYSNLQSAPLHRHLMNKFTITKTTAAAAEATEALKQKNCAVVIIFDKKGTHLNDVIGEFVWIKANAHWMVDSHVSWCFFHSHSMENRREKWTKLFITISQSNNRLHCGMWLLNLWKCQCDSIWLLFFDQHARVFHEFNVKIIIKISVFSNTSLFIYIWHNFA